MTPAHTRPDAIQAKGKKNKREKCRHRQIDTRPDATHRRSSTTLDALQDTEFQETPSRRSTTMSPLLPERILGYASVRGGGGPPKLIKKVQRRPVTSPLR